jgi:NAD(P)-dependent dehydrogenase (short-subunit alcohol dehydrogenase family)
MTILDRFRLDGQVALVTGGSRGLGLEIAVALAEVGARVALLARRAQYFEEARALLPDALPLLGNVALEADVQRAVAETTAAFGAPSVLVNAAGISWGASAMEMPVEKVQEVLAVNVVGSFLTAKAVAPAMRERGWGKIINIASLAGLQGTPPELLDAVGYSASKGGVIALTRDLAAKWGRYGIRVNAIAPGFFRTKMTEKLLPRIEQMVAAATPLGRIGAPGEVAGAALFLASPASDYVTGVTIPVDGGQSAI